MTARELDPTEKSLAHALLLQQAGQLQAAEQVYLDILHAYPAQADANYKLGLLLQEDQRIDASLPYFKAALEGCPQEALHWLSYIKALIQAGCNADAQLVLSYGVQAGLSGQDVDSLALALDIKPPDTRSTPMPCPPSAVEDELVGMFAEQRYAEIENKILALVQQYPGWLVGWKILSDTLLVQKKDARLPALKALQLNEGDAKEYCYYGLILKSHGDLKGAASAFEQAIKLKPDYAAAYNNLGVVSKDMGDIAAGVMNYQHALELNPGYASCYSNLLFCLSHAEHMEPRALYEAHCQFSQRYEMPLKTLWPKHRNKRDPARCLQVGFVSADFRDHSLAYFIEPLLQYLCVSMNLSLHAYATSVIEDKVTHRLREKFRHWHQVADLTDEQLAKKIQADAIDVLIDLDGHTAGNRLLTFAMKPAPVQASWLGYLATTGLTAMDYYFADRYLLPPGKLDSQFTEKLVQLPANAPFTPFAMAPDVNALPALKNGFITFACFNRINKITFSVVKLWAQLLKALPNARMLLGGMPQEGSYDSIVTWFASEGIAQDRLIFHPRSSMENYLNLHHEVDICLDTFPSNGVTTTCHALWMGVPTLCIEGDRLASRGAFGVMMHVGLDEFVVAHEADFVRQGLYWASHMAQLVDVRASLRVRFEQSNLAQPDLIAEGLERAFRQMWQQWCAKLPAKSFEISPH